MAGLFPDALADFTVSSTSLTAVWLPFCVLAVLDKFCCPLGRECLINKSLKSTCIIINGKGKLNGEREREREEDATVWKIVREDRREMESGGGGEGICMSLLAYWSVLYLLLRVIQRECLSKSHFQFVTSM